MKRIAMVLMALAMVFAAVPVNATEYHPPGRFAEYYPEVSYNVILPEEFVLHENGARVGVIVKCNGCNNAYVNITCQGVSGTEPLGACNWTSHENYGCTVSNLYRYHNGRCDSCAKYYYSIYDMPTHHHSQVHSYNGGGRDEFVSCIYC